jgi:hypothetical protein
MTNNSPYIKLPKKWLLTPLAFFLCFFATAQSSISLPESNLMPIRGNGHDSLGAIAKITGITCYLFLKSSSLTEDSLGNFITVFKFGNPNRIVAYNITIVLQFNRLVDSVNYVISGTVKKEHITIADNRSGTSYSASELTANGTVTAIVKSKEKIFTTITGVAGEL